MGITPQLRASIKAKEARAAKEAKDRELEQRWDQIMADTFELIDKAAPFMDEECPANRWPPSKLLKITYLAASTSGRSGAEKDAAQWVLRMLDRARKLWVAGFHPNPLLPDEELIRRDSGTSHV